MYGEAVAQRVAGARFQGELDNETVRIEAENPVCGDKLRLSLEIKDGRIIAARYKASGCPPAIAAADVLVELITDKPLAEAKRLTKDDLLALLPDLPKTSEHALALAVSAVKKISAEKREV